MARSSAKHSAARASDSAPLAALLPSWELALRASGKSPKTIRSYTDSVRKLSAYLAASGLADDVESTGPAEVRAFLVSEIDRTSPASAQVHYRNLRVYFGWLIREGERSTANPVTREDKPSAPERVKPFLSDNDLAGLLKACRGEDFEARRDTAIIRILIDTGVRVSGLANLRYDPEDESRCDVFLAQQRLRVTLKGGRQTWVPIGRKTANAIDRYLRARARTAQRASGWLWVGLRGHDVSHLTDSGIRGILRRRAEQAGVQDVHPHRFRHTFADAWLARGGSVDDLMYVAGWTTYDMPLRYARGRGMARAAEAHKRLSPGDRI
jgi:site-specific recombinase XerD